MKIKIDCDEYYPFYKICGMGEECELTNKEVEIITLAMKNFAKAQEIMEKAFNRPKEDNTPEEIFCYVSECALVPVGSIRRIKV